MCKKLRKKTVTYVRKLWIVKGMNSWDKSQCRCEFEEKLEERER